MEFHAITPEGMAHVCSVHRGAGDLSPLQMISVKELARLQGIEAAHVALVASLTAWRRPGIQRVKNLAATK